jgi:sortase (surface protein transpeptidase)
MAPIQKDVITLVTCGGGWEPNPTEENGGNYTHRIVVRAERVASVGVG